MKAIWRATVVVFLSALAVAPAFSAPKRINGVCGPANGVASQQIPASGLCQSGTPSTVTQSGDNWVWACWGTGPGSKSSSCLAPILTSPTLSLVVSPPSPTISSSSTLGTAVAMLTGQWSDGSQFTGSFQFVSPNFSDGGLFQISGNELILNGDASALGGTVQHVTLEAVQ